MLGSIQPVGAGMTGHTPMVDSLSGRSGQVGSAGLGSAASPMFGGTTDAVGGDRGIQDMQAAVSQLITGLGGAVDDKLLRMLIALIILTALLQQMQGESGGQGDALSGLGGRGQGGQGGLQGDYFSSTTISIEQTTTTIMFSSTESYSSGGALDGASSGGGRLDVSA